MRIYLDIPKEDASRALGLGARRDSACGRYFIPEDADPEPFSAWVFLPTPKSDTDNYLSLTELLSRVDKTLAREMPNSVWVRLEVSHLDRRNGHLYLDVVDRDDSGIELSKSRANIWASQANRIEDKFHEETGSRLRAGMKLLVSVKVNFHAKYGFSVSITDIDPKFTLGDMEAKLRRIRETLTRRGESSMNRDLSSPYDIANVAVISPENAAGLGDFKIEADKLTVAGICRFRYFTAIFQGPETRNSILESFKSVHDSHEIEGYDVLVMIRGGGQIDDLHWLNDLTLARLVCRIPIPVFTGIGHEKDSTVLDECAHRSFGTPSKVIGHIRELIFTRAVTALEDWNDLQRKASRSVEISESGVDQGMSEFSANVCRILDDAGNRATTNLMSMVSRAGRLETIAEGRVGMLHTSILESGRSYASMAGSSAWNLMAKVNERSNGAIGSFQIKIYSDFASIKLAARRSIDGIDKHIENFSMEVAANALIRAKRVSNESKRVLEEVENGVNRSVAEVSRVVNENYRVTFFETRRAADSVASGFEGFAGEISRFVLRMAGIADESSDLSMHHTASSIARLLDDRNADTDVCLKDLKYFAMRSVEIAEQSFKDQMSGIVAMGVEPTLKRGFTIVYSEGKPVTTRKEAEKHHALEICFNDGRLNVTKSDK